MNSFFKKISFIVATIVFCFSVATPQPANAQAVFDLPTEVASAATQVYTFAASNYDEYIKPQLNKVAYGIAQKALEQMTNNTVKWIKGGFQGNPKFAVDTNQLRSDTLDMVTTDISNQLAGSELCNFDPNFKVNLLVSAGARQGTLKQKVACPFLKDALGGKIDPAAFYKDFSKGGWVGFESSLQDAGNPFGVGLIVSSELNKKTAEARAAQDQKLNWSNGFTDVVDTGNCSYPPAVKEALDQPARITTTGDAVGADGDSFDNPNYIPPEARKIYQQTYCQTTTPGSTIAGQLTKSLGMESDRLNLANDMDKIFSAAIGQLTKQATEGIFNALTPTAKPYRPAYTAPNTASTLASLHQMGQVAETQGQLTAAQRRLDSANQKVTDIQKSIADLRAKMGTLSPTCPSTTPGAECASLMNDMDTLLKNLDSAKKNVLNNMEALRDAQNSLKRATEDADRAKAVTLTADAYNQLLPINARFSNDMELANATKALRLDNATSTRDAAALVRNATPASSASIQTALDAKNAASVYRAKVDAADSAIAVAQRAQFGKEDTLYGANLRMIDLIKSGATLADIRKQMDTIAVLSAENNAAIEAVSVARQNALAVRGIASSGGTTVTCLSASASGNCSGLDNVAQWIADAQKTITEAEDLQKARTTVSDIASQSI
jgi:hypothetical protein